MTMITAIIPTIMPIPAPVSTQALSFVAEEGEVGAEVLPEI
jgi:hypothetical protein